MSVSQHLWAMATDPAWHSAIATWLILVVTGVAAVYGVPAARAAASTFRLESQPAILVRRLDREERAPIDPAHLAQVFVVDGMPLISDGVTIRLQHDGDSRHPNFQASLNKTAEFEFRNAGRSPALAVEIPFTVSVPVFVKDPDSDDLEPKVGTQQGTGAITLPGIGAGQSAYALVQNLLGEEVTLKAQDAGSYVRLEERRRVKSALPIVALQSFQLPGAI